MTKPDIILAGFILFSYDKLEGDTTYYYWQKTTRAGEYFSKFDRMILNDAKCTRKIISKTTLAKGTFQCKKLVTSANSTEI
jgi:hypothetical protein